MRQATKIAELVILIVALALSALADILPVIGKALGGFAGRLYRNRYRTVAWLKIAYATIRYGSHGRVYVTSYLSDWDPEFTFSFNVDRHCGTLHRHHACDRYRMALCIVRKLQRRLTAIYRASYGIICQHLLAQSGMPVTIPDPRIIAAERNKRIRQIMQAY